MRKIQKEYRKTAKENTTNFELNRKDYDALAKVRKSMLNELDSVVSLQQDIKQYDKRIDGLQSKITMSQNDRNLYGNKLAVLEDKIESTKRQKFSLITQLRTEGKKLFSENSLNELEQVEQELQNKFAKLEQERIELNKSQKEMQENRDTMQVELNQLLNAESNSNEIATTLRRLKEDCIRTFKLQNISADLDERLNNKLLQMLKEKHTTLENKINMFNEEYEAEVKDHETRAKENYKLLVQDEVSHCRLNSY